MPTAAPNGIMGFAPMIIIFAIFYFLVIRPEKKKQKEHKEMVTNLKKNDQVITSAGIYGTVVDVRDEVVVLRLDQDVRVKFDRNAIAHVIKKEEVIK